MLRALTLLSVLLAACGDDREPAAPDAGELDASIPDADISPRAVTITFKPQVGSAAFACGQTYAAMGAEATTITPRDFRMYVSDVKLIAADGTRVPLALTQDGTWQFENVAMLDFENFTGGCLDGTPETNVTLRGTVPNGTYTGLAFTIGVPEAMNHVDMTTLPAPLNVNGLFWSWGLGHVFLAVVTHADVTTPAPSTNDHYIHVGSIGCTGDPTLGQSVTCSKPNRPFVELTGFDPLTQPVVADYGAVISKSSLATGAGCHSFTESTCGYPFDLVGLNWFSGSQTPTTQKLFRTEP